MRGRPARWGLPDRNLKPHATLAQRSRNVIDQTLVQGFQQALSEEHPRQLLRGARRGIRTQLCRRCSHAHRLESVCLMPGELEPELAQAAPYLVEVPVPSPFAELFLTRGLGKHWGILATSGAGLRNLRMHFRKLLSVWGPDGKPLYFRYYDPRVLRIYLPTCNTDELPTLFGPVTAYLCGGRDGRDALSASPSPQTLWASIR